MVQLDTKPTQWYPQSKVSKRPFYRYSGHIELIRFKDYYGMLRAGADPGEVKWVNFHPPFSEPPFNHAEHRPQTPQPGIGSITLLQKFTPHFKILDPHLQGA